MKRAFWKNRIEQMDQARLRGYRALYGEEEAGKRAEKDRHSLRNQYGMVLLLVLVASLLLWQGMVRQEEMTTEEKGNLITVRRPASGEEALTVDVQVMARRGGTAVKMDRQLQVHSRGDSREETPDSILADETEEDRLMRSVDSAIRSVNSETGMAVITLPDRLEDGTKLTWKREQQNRIPYLILGGVAMIYAVYRGRYSRLRREEEQARRNIQRELPGFLNELVLLLEAGMVLPSAFRRMMEERRSFGIGQEDYFYRQLDRIDMKSREVNSPFHRELVSFAKQTGLREWIRLAGVLEESIGSGTDLAGTLRQESEALWFTRKKRAEEAGRLAETKMTLPLMILLGVLVLITIAPAMLDI